MDADTRRKVEMGTRSVDFSEEHLDSDPGQAVTLAKLKALVAEAIALVTAQREGQLDVQTGSSQKKALRRAMIAMPIRHLRKLGKVAAQEQPELGNAFQFKPGGSTYLAFQTGARAMAMEAETHRELLAKHGLAPAVLEGFFRSLDAFDAAMALGNAGRTAHIGATLGLHRVAAEIVRTVQVMDARNRQRFQDDERLLGSWLSASRVLGTRRGSAAAPPEGGTPASEQEKPAA